MGSASGRGGFPAEMSGLRSSGYDGTETGGEEYERSTEEIRIIGIDARRKEVFP